MFTDLAPCSVLRIGHSETLGSPGCLTGLLHSDDAEDISVLKEEDLHSERLPVCRFVVSPRLKGVLLQYTSATCREGLIPIGVR